MQVIEQNNRSVLFIGFVWPEQTATAASQNILSYVRALKHAGFTVHFACAAQRSLLSTPLEAHDIVAHQIALNCDSFDTFVQDLAPDIVVFDRFLTEEQFGWRVIKSAPEALRVLDLEDLHFLRQGRHMLYKAMGYQPRQAHYLNTNAIFEPGHEQYAYNALTTRELACVYRCDLNISLSEPERDILIKHFHVPSENIAHVPYLLNEDIAASAMKNPSTSSMPRTDFVSIGNFRHAPNIDAVNVLLQHIWPSIFARLPRAKCRIYGAYLPPKIQQLHQPKRGIYIHGHIPDHLHMLSSAKVLLAPIQFGAGVKGKIVDALRCALPSITTSIGVEGITYSQWPGAVVNTRDEFIEAAINTYNCEQDFTALAHDILHTNFIATQPQQKFVEAVETALDHKAKRRIGNFMQQMLSHHTVQTHQYMSQWIQAKNAD
ncbi:glycosyltransferase [Glaciecola siphonariae]|uniref:Glycosyltransferase n=1 Tax=Glaciecola siphonariae TaxID=521012 RepID=A0ABV9LV41_9ALTE